MASKTISIQEFAKSAIGLTDEEIQQQIEELKSQWVTVDGWDSFQQSAQNEARLTPPVQTEQTDQLPPDTVQWGQLAGTLGSIGILPAAFWVKKLIKNMIWPSEKEIGDAVAWVKRMGESDKYVPWLRDSRGLYNYTKSIQDMAFQNKEDVKAQAADRVITTKALDPLKEEIIKLEKVWAGDAKINSLKKQLSDLESKFNSNGEMSFASAEDIKKYHAGESTYYKEAERVWASPEANTANLWHTKVAEWFRKEIKSVVPEVEPRNATYWAAKDITAGIAKMSNTVSQQPVSTPIRQVATKWAKIIQSVPWIATAGKVLDPLKEARYAERKIPKLITMFKKYWDRVLDYIDTEASKWKMNLAKAWQAAEEIAPKLIAKWVQSLWSSESFLPPWAMDMKTPKPASFPKGKQEYDTKTAPNIISEFGNAMAKTVAPLTAQQKTELSTAKTKWIQTPWAGNIAQIVTPKKVTKPIDKKELAKIGWPKFGVKTGF